MQFQETLTLASGNTAEVGGAVVFTGGTASVHIAVTSAELTDRREVLGSQLRGVAEVYGVPMELEIESILDDAFDHGTDELGLDWLDLSEEQRARAKQMAKHALRRLVSADPTQRVIARRPEELQA